jgi:hypothetical protein
MDELFGTVLFMGVPQKPHQFIGNIGRRKSDHAQQRRSIIGVWSMVWQVFSSRNF